MFQNLLSLNTRRPVFILLLLLGSFLESYGTLKSPALSGNWSNPAIWGGTTVPSTSDNVTIPSGFIVVMDTNITVKDIVVSGNSTLNWIPGMRLTINGSFTVNGTVNMNGGLISLGSPGLQFTLGAGSVFTWDPGINTSVEATLFTRGVENFSSSSTLIIKKWYNYSTALGSVVSGNFGNLILNSLSGANAIVEWDQNNQFQTHLIAGTLTIDQGWVTLDKSGSISTTILSKVVLTSVNSYLYGHNGNHPGSFQINTGTFTNNGGIFYALNDGTGNVTVNINGDFNNTGNVKVIMNSGVIGAGNGNAIFNVTGTYRQSTGDTRFIYNVASSASGTYSSTIGNLTLTGGIFMGQTGIHTGGGICNLNIINNLSVNFTENADKFRGTSLSSIGTNYNNTQFTLRVGGNVILSGPTSAEFTTSASLGSESIYIGGNLQVSGGVFSANYGITAAAHAVDLQIDGHTTLSGGTVFLTRNAGNSKMLIKGNLNLSAGVLIVKASAGTVQLDVSGQYVQSGGTVYLHGNSALASADKISMSVLGNYSQSAGIFSFDDNSSASSATHELILRGSTCSISGPGVITHAGAGTSPVFGLIRYSRTGEQQFQRVAGHSLQQVKQQVEANCILTSVNGNIQVCSHNDPSTSYFRILPYGEVQLKTGQFESDAVFANSGIQVDSLGTLGVSSAYGLYNGNNTAAISATGNMDYSLHPYSVVVYDGGVDQTVTGTSHPVTTGPQHQYGILRIGMQNSSAAVLNEGDITVRTRLELNNGILDLHAQSLFLENGNPDAVIRTGGFVLSENDQSYFVWKNITGGAHEFPFGQRPSVYIPVLFAPISGFGTDVSISTRSTSSPDNRPVPGNLVSTVLSSINNLFAEDDVIDRWWKVNANGMTANVTLKYSSTENTLSIGNRLSPLGLRSWNGISWTEPTGYGYAITSGVGSVTITNVSQFSNWILAVNNSVLPIELSLFQVKAFKNEIRLDWTTSSEINNDYFTIERSGDGEDFIVLGQVPGAGNSTETEIYSFIDPMPLEGRNYYRLKQTDYDGQYTYSDVKSAVFADPRFSTIDIQTIAPNPFEDHFRVSFSLPQAGNVKILLITSSGKTLGSYSQQGNRGMNEFEYQDGGNLQSGTYILQLISGGEMLSKKIIKK